MTKRLNSGWLLLATTFAVLLLAFPALAKGNKAHNPNNGRGKITAVSATSITVTPKKGEAKTFTLASNTKVKLDGQSATTADLAVGQHAKVKSKDGVTAHVIKARTHGKKKNL